MKPQITFITICFSCFLSFSQSVTARLIDKSTKNPIPYATIKTGEYSGIISNEEGYFTLNDNDDFKTVTMSCLGYQSITLSIQDIKNLNYLIELEEAINQLNEVFISNKKPNADSIIAKVKANIPANYAVDLYKYNVFRRSTGYVNFKSLEFEIEKASHFSKQNLKSANEEMNLLIKKIKESDMKEFTDFKAEFYSLNKDSSRIVVSDATKLLDAKNNFSIDEIQENAQKIILTYLDTTKTYKLKTGIFKIEDSLSLNDDAFNEDKENEFSTKYLNFRTKSLLKQASFYENSFINKLLNTDWYEYTFEGITTNNNELTYIINYTPQKGKAKYSGKLFISDDTFAITRVDYSYYKNRHGSKLNLKFLMGVKYIENISEGTILFEKSSHNIYQPKYIKCTSGSYFYVSRGLKFIENSSAKNKVSFDFTLEGDNRNKVELLITESNQISLSDFATVKQVEKVPVETLSTFDKSHWQNKGTLEPTQEMKAFKVEE